MIKRLRFVLLAVSLLVHGSGPASGQDDSTNPLQDLAFLVGDWDFGGQALVDEQTVEVAGVAAFEWQFENSGLRQHLRGVAGESQYFEGLGFWVGDAFFGGPALAWTDTLTVTGLYRVFSDGFDGETLFARSQDSGPYSELRLNFLGEDEFEWVFAVGDSAASLPSEVLTLRFTRRDGPPPDDLYADAEPIPAPPPETEQFAFYVGDWAIESRALVEGEDWIEGAGSAHVEWTLGGHVLEDTWQAPSFIPDSELGWGMTRYNVERGEWERITAMESGFGRTWEGACSEEECVLTDDRFFNIEADRFQWEHRHGGPDVVWAMDFVRE